MNPAKRKKLYRMSMAEEKAKLAEVSAPQAGPDIWEGEKEQPKAVETTPVLPPVVEQVEVKPEPQAPAVEEQPAQVTEEKVSLQGEMISILEPTPAPITSFESNKKKKKVQ